MLRTGKEMVATDPNIGVTVLGKAGLRYREGARTVRLDGEILHGAVSFEVYVNNMFMWEDSSQPVAQADRQRIMANIDAVFRHNGLRIEFR